MNLPERFAMNADHDSLSSGQLAQEIVARLAYRVGKDPKVANPNDWFQATLLTARDHAIEHWMRSTRDTYDSNGNDAVGGLLDGGQYEVVVLDEDAIGLKSLDAFLEYLFRRFVIGIELEG